MLPTGVTERITKDDFNEQIENSVNASRSLQSTIALLEHLFKHKLGDDDCLYVEDKYEELLINYFLEEVPQQIIKSINVNTLLEFVNGLHKLNNLEQCCDVLNEFYSESNRDKKLLILKKICSTSSKIKSYEKQYINEFVQRCYMCMHMTVDYISGELNFNKCLTDLLKWTKNPAQLCQRLGLLPEVVKHFENDLYFKEFLNKLETKCTYKHELKFKQAAKLITNQTDFVLIKDIKNIIERYLKEPILREEHKDGRLLLEVSGKHIVVSKVLSDIENKLQCSNLLEEVRFVDAGVVHVDVNLSKPIWQGKNVVLYAETVIVSDDRNVIWDVSGKNATDRDIEADTGDDGSGLIGADGQNGESGGNVVFIVSEIKNAQNLTIKSNGGRGGKGQDGGKGLSGRDGDFLEEEIFKTFFPPLSKFFNWKKRNNLELTKSTILSSFQSVKCFFYGQSFLSGTISKPDFETYFSECINKLQNIYCELKTNSDCKITFSFYYGGEITESCQSFLLHEGSFGEEGKPGGIGGQGGKGGYAGEIDIFVDNTTFSTDISLSRVPGKEGEPGKTGIDGNQGGKGADRGYVDCSRDISGNWPKYSIPNVNDNISLCINYSEKKDSERVFCAHNSLYAKIIPKKIGFTRQRTYREAINKPNFAHETHVQRKKAINVECIKYQYEQQLSDSRLFKLNSVLENIKDTVLELMENSSLETSQITTDVKVVRSVGYFSQMNYISSYKDNYISEEAVKEENHDNVKQLSVPELVNLIKNNPSNLDNWTKLSQIRLSMIQLQHLWDILHEISVDGYIMKHIKTVFFCKYQLAVLEYVAEHFSNSFNTVSAHNLTPSDYLLQCFDNVLSVYRKEKTRKITANSVEKFLLSDNIENRKEAQNIFFDMLNVTATKRKAINDILIVFLNEFCDNPLVHKKLEEVAEFEKNKYEKLKIKLISFKSALIRSNVKTVYNALIESIIKGTNEKKIKFENEIKNNKFLYLMYKSYVKSFNDTFSWENMLKRESNEDFEIINILLNAFIKHGPFCAVYREFLAYYFDKNIIIYSKNVKNETIMLHNHNPKASTTVHFLIEEEQILQLKLNNELVELVNSQTTQGRYFNDILAQIDLFIEKKQFDEYISKNPFMSDCYDGFDYFYNTRVRLTYIIMEEDYINTVLNAYNLSEDKDLIRYRLHKLKLEFTRCESIIYYMALHFENEGTHISAMELCMFINFILKCSLKLPHLIPSLSWIVAAYSQTQWLPEVILLKLELRFSKKLIPSVKSKWRQYLLELTDRQLLMLMVKKLSDNTATINMENFEETIYLLSKIPQSHVRLELLNIDDWKYYLKEKFWLYQLKAITNWSDEQLKTASFYLVDLENVIGTNFCTNFITVLNTIEGDLHSESSRQIILDVLRMFTSTELCLTDSLLQQLKGIKLYNWKKEIKKIYFSCSELRTSDNILKIIKETSSVSDNVMDKLNIVFEMIDQSNQIKNILEEHEDYKFIKECISVITLNKEESSVFDKIKEYVHMSATCATETITNVGQTILDFFSINSKPLNSHETLCIMFAAVVLAAEREFEFKIRFTQKLAVMTMLLNEKNVLSQVSTGEGKSIIIVLFSIIKALSGQKIDIITSSHVLAERDVLKYKSVYNLFGVTVDHNCYKNIKTRKNVYSNNSVVYGDLANFQRDYLLDHFYNKNIIGDRMFEIVVVDEVDSMLLDKGNNTLYLSHEIPGLDKLEQVFVFIWISLNSYTDDPNKKYSVSELKQKILYEIFGLVTKDDLKSLDSELNNEQVNKIFNYLVNKKIISHTGKVLVKDNSIKNLSDMILNKNHIQFLLTKIVGREKKIIIPNYLNEFVEIHLEKWITSGVKAMSMETGIDYVVDVDRLDSSSDRTPNIIIIDRDTGNDLISSQWDDGLHQFLQLKHGCRLSQISLKAVFISNVSYLKKYHMLFGLTGTIGSIKEQNLLKEIYEVDFIKIPTARPKVFTEEESIFCTSIDIWTNAIWDSVYKKVKQNRSVLIICESVKDVMTVEQKFVQNEHRLSLSNVHIYKRDYEELTVAKELFGPGQVIISTNLAGRGTDIQLEKNLVNEGGLHICLTFFPSNNRVEEQAYGRAARKGEPGSAQMIFKSSALENLTNVIDLKKQRNDNESLRIADLKRYNESFVQPQEKCFNEFSNLYKMIMNSSKHKDEKVKNILLQVSLDQWAFWLEKNKNCHDLKSESSIIELLKNLCDIKFANFIDDPTQLTKLGLILLDKREYKEANLLFNRVIKAEPSFSENARYYRICTKLVLPEISFRIEDIISELTLVVKLLKDRIQSLLLSANIIDYLKKKNPLNVLQIESFKEQHVNICKIYGVFIQHIYSIIGQEFSSESLAIPTIFSEECASRIYKDLVRKGVIVEPQIKTNCSLEDLEFVSLYGLIPNEIMSALKTFNKNEQHLLKSLKKHLLVPSREFFWKELLTKQILINEEKYSIVDLNKLYYVDPSLVNIIELLSIQNHLERDNQIWLYQLKEIDCFHEKKLVLTKKNVLKEEIGDFKYKLFKQKRIIYPNKQATLLKAQNFIALDHFDCLKKEDFNRVNISNEIAHEIIHELEKKCIIGKIASNEFNLLINPKDIVSIKLSRFKAYSAEVVSLLSRCFAFRIALIKSWELMDSQINSDDPLCLPLQIRLEKRIIEDLFDHGVLQKSMIGPNKQKCVSETLEELYPNKITLKKFDSFLSDVFEEESTRNIIIGSLVEKQCLTLVNNYSPFSDPVYTCQMPNKDIFEELPSTIKRYSKTIQLVLQRYLDLSSSTQQNYINKFTREHACRLYELETPTISLICIYDILKDYVLPLGECSVFSLNGFDKLVDFEESRSYSRNMIISTFVVALLGTIEITVGVLYGMPQILMEGAADFNFCISCLYSGQFSLKEFGINKLTRLAQTISNHAISVIFKFNSTFGQTLSLCSMFGDDAHLPMKTGAWEVMRYITTTCIIGESYAAINKFIEPRIKEIGEKLMEKSSSEIDNIIKNHTVIESVKDMYLHIGNEHSKHVIKVTSRGVMEEYKSKYDKDLLMLLNKLCFGISKLIKIVNKSINQRQIIHLGLNEIIELILILKDTFSNTMNLIDCNDYFKSIQTVTTEIMDSLQNCLEKNCNESEIGRNCRYMSDNFDNQSYTSLEKTESRMRDAIDFSTEICNDWQLDVKEVYKYKIERCIIDPFMTCFTNVFVSYLANKNNSKFISNIKLNNLPTLGSNYRFEIDRSNSFMEPKDCNYFLAIEYEDCLTYLLNTKNNTVSFFLEILKASITADVSLIKEFCTIIPMALKIHGLNLPVLQIVIESDTVHHITANDATPDSDVLTITILPNKNFLRNFKKDKIILENFFDALYQSIIQLYPQHCDKNAQYVRNLVTRTIEEDHCIQQYITNNMDDVFENTGTSQYDVGKTETSSTAIWRNELQKLVKIKERITNGFVSAVEKINHHLYLSHPYFKYFKLKLDDFKEIAHELVPNEDCSLTYFNRLATKYDLILPLKSQKNSQLVDYIITMSLEYCVSRKKHHPNGPHILYKILPSITSWSEHIEKESFEGHVLLGFEYEELIYGVKDLHSAGELILPSFSSFNF